MSRIDTPHESNFSLSPDILKATAKAAKLRYVSDRSRGIRREPSSDGFSYYDRNDRIITDEEELARIRKLAIPPAYQDVWICPYSNGHLQATGRDARGRKQYRYHPRWRQVRDEGKFAKMLLFGKVLPTIRAKAERDLAKRGLPREKVLAAIVRLLESTLIRVGNEQYAKTNNSFGLTTLRNRHVKVDGESRIRFDFRGKSGTEHHIDLRNKKLAGVVRRCQDLPGQELFQYLDDDGQPRTVGSDEVNEYLREITGEEVTAKDFVPGQPPTLPRWPFSAWKSLIRRQKQRRTLSRLSRRWRRCWVIRRRFAASATFIPRFLMAISTEACFRH